MRTRLLESVVETLPLLAYGGLAAVRVGVVGAQAEPRLRGIIWTRRLRSAGSGLRIGTHVSIHGAEKITLGRNVTLYDFVYLNADSFIAIGDNTHVDVFSSIYGHGGVKIGENCAIAAGVRIYSQSNRDILGVSVLIVDQGIERSPVSIGDDVWIGANAIILPGVSIGPHSIVGAGAVVRDDVPESSVVAGVPARIIRQRA